MMQTTHSNQNIYFHEAERVNLIPSIVYIFWREHNDSPLTLFGWYRQLSSINVLFPSFLIPLPFFRMRLPSTDNIVDET